MCVGGGGGGGIWRGNMVRYSTQTCVVTLPSFCFLKAIVYVLSTCTVHAFPST